MDKVQKHNSFGPTSLYVFLSVKETSRNYTLKSHKLEIHSCALFTLIVVTHNFKVSHRRHVCMVYLRT
jgi:hypothetical protein